MQNKIETNKNLYALAREIEHFGRAGVISRVRKQPFFGVTGHEDHDCFGIRGTAVIRQNRQL